MTTFKWLAATFALAAATAPTLQAEPHCPGNVASLPFRLVNRHQIVLPVTINHSGPFGFLLDTGTQTTIVDSSLAAALHLSTSYQALPERMRINVALDKDIKKWRRKLVESSGTSNPERSHRKPPERHGSFVSFNAKTEGLSPALWLNRCRFRDLCLRTSGEGG